MSPGLLRVVLPETRQAVKSASVLKDWRRYVHFDFHVLQVLLQRGWGILAGFVNVLLVPAVLNGVEQGYYYTFASLLALQVFFELGFNVVVMQIVGHEAARLQIDREGRISGDETAAARLGSLLQLLRRWYLIAALSFFVVVAGAGFWFFRRQGSLAAGQWVGVWLLLVFFTAVNLFFSPRLAVLEGIGRVGNVARLRLAQSVLGSLLLWSAFALGAGLWAVPFMSGTAAACTALWLARYGRLYPPAPSTGAPRICWQSDVFPLQWRIALSWASGWFIFSAFTPLLFANQGAVEAGRLGLALSVFSAISTLGMSWINASAPQMVRYVALRDRTSLNQLYRKVLKSSLTFVMLADLVLLGAVGLAARWEVPLVARIASWPVLVCLGLVTMVNSFIFAAATYMRAHKEEPMLVASLVAALLTALTAWIGSKHGAAAMMLGYAAVTTLVGLPWTLFILRRFVARHRYATATSPILLSNRAIDRAGRP